MPNRSSSPFEIVSDESKMMNYGNLQHQLTSQYLDDITADIVLLKHKEKQEQEKIVVLETKMDHMLHDSEEIKNVIITA